jgi:hypothetical protein
MKILLGAIVVGSLALSMTVESFAAEGASKSSKTTQTDTTDSSDSDGKDEPDRVSGGTTDYQLGIHSWGYSAENPDNIDVTFEAEFRLATSNMVLCWTDSSAFPCWDNQVNVTGNGATPIWGYPLYQSEDATWLNNLWWWQITLDADTGIFTGYYDAVGDWVDAELEPIECGVEYDFKLRNGIWYDTMSHTFPCQEEEECTDCPYGGWYDGAHCTLGSAPPGATAYITNGYFAYMPVGGPGVCTKGDVFLRDGGCGIQPIPTDVNSFTLSNNFWYYDGVCE